MKITYEGDHQYMHLMGDIIGKIEPHHKDYLSAPSHILTLRDMTELHVIAYHMPVKGIKVKCWHDTKNRKKSA